MGNDPLGRGRPTIFNQEVADAICDALAKGATLRAVCRDPGMPHESTVRLWARQNNEFYPQYARARELGYECMADEIIEISDDSSGDVAAAGDDDNAPRANSEFVARSRLRVDTRKWLLSKALPKVYGDKLAHTGPDGESPVAMVVTWQTAAPDES